MDSMLSPLRHGKLVVLFSITISLSIKVCQILCTLTFSLSIKSKKCLFFLSLVNGLDQQVIELLVTSIKAWVKSRKEKEDLMQQQENVLDQNVVPLLIEEL